MRELARAKVNLFLHVVGRRADGYHLLDSLAVFPDVGDALEAVPAAGLSLAIDGPFGKGLPCGPDNLVLRAAYALQQACGTPAGAALRLAKRLPVASGIGGGSADAAAALRALSALWEVAVPAGLAQGLGADVPVCMASRPARMGGVGEVLGPAPALPPCGLVLVNPGVAVATPDVFRARGPGFHAPAVLPAGWPDAHTMAADLARLSNDLEAPALALCPPTATVLTWLRSRPGCLLARMSGSGATCFALFKTAAAARTVADAAPPGWWTWSGGLHTPPPGP